MRVLLCRAALLAAILVPPARGWSQAAAPPAAHEATAFDFMNLLSQHDRHDLAHERWNAYGQATYLTVFKLPFAAPYTNADGSINSLSPDYERSFAGTFSLFFGARIWQGGELYFTLETIAERPLSLLRGLGGATEIYELQKTGGQWPAPYRARLFYRQTIDFPGEALPLDSNPLQLGTTVSKRRLVLSFGNYSVIDVFDKNSVSGDPRQTFFNEAFMTHAAYDFPAEARGFTVGVAAEWYHDAWALRLGHFIPPKHPNQQSLDYRFWERYGTSLELEHDHTLMGLPGAVRLLGYRNQNFSGRFDEAVAAFERDPAQNAGNCPDDVYNYGSGNFGAPDLCWVRRGNVKMGVGINVEQYVARDVGLFLRAMWADGKSEVDAYDASDGDISFGAVAKGTLWQRPFDVAGVGLSVTWISRGHARYLAMGGVDGFLGDGHLRQGVEGLLDAFYSVNLLRAIWLAVDYQLLWNPGYNTDRAGPIHMPGVKIHAEF